MARPYPLKNVVKKAKVDEDPLKTGPLKVGLSFGFRIFAKILISSSFGQGPYPRKKFHEDPLVTFGVMANEVNQLT